MASLLGKTLGGMAGKAVSTAEKEVIQPAVQAVVEASAGSGSARAARYPYVGGFRRRTPAERERRAIARASIVPPAPSTVTEYPFSSIAVVHPRVNIKDPRIGILKDGQVTRGVMAAVTEQLRVQYDPDGSRTALFSRSSPQCLPPGSILTVEMWNDSEHTSFSTFSGVIIAIRRRNTSTSFVLRNVVAKTGTEVRYNLYSPMIKDIKVIARADGNRKASPLRRFRRAKLYFLREQEKRLPNVMRFTQAVRAKEDAIVRAREAKEAKEAQEAEYARQAVKRNERLAAEAASREKKQAARKQAQTKASAEAKAQRAAEDDKDRDM